MITVRSNQESWGDGYPTDAEMERFQTLVSEKLEGFRVEFENLDTYGYYQPVSIDEEDEGRISVDEVDEAVGYAFQHMCDETAA